MQDFKRRPFLYAQLMRPVTTGRIVHAQIFSGPEGSGKYDAAKYVSQALNCTSPLEKPCGECPSCLRFRDNNAPELIEIRRDPKKAIISVDAIREMTENVLLRPEGKAKCVIICEAERMNAAAQNALLKTLEEPPGYAAFFLLTASCTALLPTIRSRCALVRFAPSGEEEIAQTLISEGADAQKARRIAAMSFGSMGRAKALMEDQATLSAADKLNDIFKAFKGRKDIPLFASKLGAFKNDPRPLLDLLEGCAGELMRGRIVTPLAQTLAKNGHDGAKLIAAVIECRKKLDAHVTYQYAVEMLLYDMIRQSNV